MGNSQTKDRSTAISEKDVEDLREKVRVLQKEIDDIMGMRESENQAYEQDMMVFALKEAEWKRERKKLREEVKRLRKGLEEREEKIRGMEGEMVGGKSDKEWELLGTDYLLEHIREERERRDETVEKWKRLYLAIKSELDNLILSANQGKGLYGRGEEENIMEELHRELKAKGETIELLQARLASMEQQESNRERELDILRQSMRIMSHKKKPTKIAKGLSRSLHF